MNPLRPLARRAAAAERDLGAPLDYLRHIADTSLAAFTKFGLFTPLAQHRKHLPPELALGSAAARVFPTTKRALGYTKACALVPIDYDR